jgi:Cu(I)/Ag(I) efflux system membrane fusion protein
MKKYRTWGIVSLLSIGLGLGLGYLLFGGKGKEKTPPPAAPPAKGTVEYTCSMHPQIRQAEPGICPLCEMDLTPLENESSDQATLLKMSPEAVKLADIQTARVGVGANGARRIRLSGKIAPDERRALTQTAHLAGRIEQLYVTFTGEEVRAGQPLALLYAPALLSAQREFLEALRMKTTNPTLLEAARAKLRNWKLPETFIEELEKSGKIQREVLVRADRSGVVTARRVAVGDYVEEGAPLFELMDLRKVWAILEAYESDLPFIRRGNRVEITAPALPGRTFLGSIAFIDPLLDPQSRTVALRVELDNASAAFKPQMFIEGEVLAGNPAGTAMVVPKTAVLWTGKRSVVYVKVPGASVPSFEFREIELGETTEKGIQVLSGLEPGEEVVIQGAFVIDAAAQLNNSASMINRMVAQDPASANAIPDMRTLVGAAFASRWHSAIQAYLDVKDALVATRPAEAAKQAERLLQVLDAVPVRDAAPELQIWWQERLGGLKAHCRKLASEQGVEAQRRQFLFVSEIMIQHIKALGGGSAALYLQYCPMAFNNQGGDWVSRQREVLNPYFGEEMLRCGVVKDSFP